MNTHHKQITHREERSKILGLVFYFTILLLPPIPTPHPHTPQTLPPPCTIMEREKFRTYIILRNRNPFQVESPEDVERVVELLRGVPVAILFKIIIFTKHPIIGTFLWRNIHFSVLTLNLSSGASDPARKTPCNSGTCKGFLIFCFCI